MIILQTAQSISHSLMENNVLNVLRQLLHLIFLKKKCLACPPDHKIDNDQKKCVANLHFTNWTGLNNFSPLDGPFPLADPTATPCPR